MTQLAKFSGLSRPIDPAYPTNRVLLYCLLGIFLLALLASWLFFKEVSLFLHLQQAAYASFTGLLSWMLARELSPDHPWDAFYAIPIGLAGLWLFPLPAYFTLLLFLLSLRLINRSCGQEIKVIDYLLLLALAGWFVYEGEFVGPLVLAITFIADSRLKDGKKFHAALAALIILALFVKVFSAFPSAQYPDPAVLSTRLSMLVIVVATAFAFYIRQRHPVKSLGDYDRKLLDAARIRAAQLLALVVAVMYSLWLGELGLGSLWPLWAAFIGLLLARFVFALMSKQKVV